jgi:hypothetical protein
MSSGRRAVCHDGTREPSFSVFAVVSPDLEPAKLAGDGRAVHRQRDRGRGVPTVMGAVVRRVIG